MRAGQTNDVGSAAADVASSDLRAWIVLRCKYRGRKVSRPIGTKHSR